MKGLILAIILLLSCSNTRLITIEFDGDSVGYSNSFGVDVLDFFKGFRFEAEYYRFARKTYYTNSFSGMEYHLRKGYSLVFAGKYIEPVISFDRYKGVGDKALYEFIGYDFTIDYGLNWYLNNDKLKLALHYISQSSDFSDSGDYFAFAFQIKL